MTFLSTLSPLERFRRGHGVLPPNHWHRPRGGDGRPSDALWMCLTWDVERQRDGTWRAAYLYRSGAADRRVEEGVYATAEAAMLAVDVLCSQCSC